MTSHLCNNVFASDALLHEDTHFTAFRFLFDFFFYLTTQWGRTGARRLTERQIVCQHCLRESDRDLYVILLIRTHPHWSLECQRWSGLGRKSFNLYGALHHQRAPWASLVKYGAGNWIWEGNWLNFRNIIWRSKWALSFWFHLSALKCSSQLQIFFGSYILQEKVESWDLTYGTYL